MSTEPCLRSQGASEVGEPSVGLNPSDLLALPEPQSGLLSWMMRQGQVTLAEATAFFGHCGDLSQDDEQTRAMLTDLRDQGFVSEIDIRGMTYYGIRLAPRRARVLPPDLWKALDWTATRSERNSDNMATLEVQKPPDHEMEIARRIQASFLPEELPQFQGWEIAARFQPARQVAGDFYDAFPLVQNRRLALVLGDVCDKGVGAALFMALFRTLIRAFAQQHYALRWMGDFEQGLARPAGGGRPVLPSIGTSALKNAMELTNEYIVNTHGSTNMFATIFLGVLDPTNGSLLFANGGHEYPILLSSAGIKDQLATTGPAVGLIPGAQFGIQSVSIEPGETLVAFTDGVTEARNSHREFYGRERLHTLLAQPTSTAAELLDSIMASVLEHMGGGDLSDDITMLAVRRQ